MFFGKKQKIDAVEREGSTDTNDPNRLKYESDRRSLIAGLGDAKDWPFGDDNPVLTEWTEQGGVASGHYFHQDIWAARKIFQKNPVKHIDVGSRIDGFVAHVATFRQIEVFDIRPIHAEVQNVTFRQHDFMHNSTNSQCDSLSCLHAIEHFGLGRYGDPVDARGYAKGFTNISNLLNSRGTFYFSVPIGRQRIEFNAHRIFSIATVVQLYEQNNFELCSFSYVDDNGSMNCEVDLPPSRILDNFDLNHGCGLFELRKID